MIRLVTMSGFHHRSQTLSDHLRPGDDQVKTFAQVGQRRFSDLGCQSRQVGQQVRFITGHSMEGQARFFWVGLQLREKTFGASN